MIVRYRYNNKQGISIVLLKKMSFSGIINSALRIIFSGNSGHVVF